MTYLYENWDVLAVLAIINVEFYVFIGHKQLRLVDLVEFFASLIVGVVLEQLEEVLVILAIMCY